MSNIHNFYVRRTSFLCRRTYFLCSPNTVLCRPYVLFMFAEHTFYVNIDVSLLNKDNVLSTRVLTMFDIKNIMSNKKRRMFDNNSYNVTINNCRSLSFCLLPLNIYRDKRSQRFRSLNSLIHVFKKDPYRAKMVSSKTQVVFFVG